MTSPFILLMPVMGVLSVLFCWGAGLSMAATRRAPARRSPRRDPRQ